MLALTSPLRPPLEAEFRKLVGGLGYQCLALEKVREGGRLVLRLTLDVEGGISLQDCETAAREVNAFLDEHDEAFSEPFFLEVSSPGPERPLVRLEDYRRFRGEWIRISWKNGKKRVLCIDDVGEDGVVTLRSREGEVLQLPWTEIRRPRLHPEV